MDSIPYDKRRKTPTGYHALAQERGFEWLGPEVQDTHKKTGWRCQCGNEWQTTFQKIQSGRGCPVCGIRLNAWLRSRKPEDYHAIAKKFGFEWLGPEVSSNKEKTRWRCSNGHEFESPYDKINSGKGCMQCAVDLRASLRRIKPTGYHYLAKKRNFKWLGPVVTSTMVKTRWRCEHGHEWEAPYDGIRAGNGCPHCSYYVNGILTSRLQRELCERVGGVLNRQFGRWYVDITLEIGDLTIAIEYDGYYWHKDKFEEDAGRDAALIGAGWKVLRIKSGTLLPEEADIKQAIERLTGGEDYTEIVLDDWGA